MAITRPPERGGGHAYSVAITVDLIAIHSGRPHRHWIPHGAVAPKPPLGGGPRSRPLRVRAGRGRGSGAAARFYFVFSKTIYIERPVRRRLPPWIARTSTVVLGPSRWDPPWIARRYTVDPEDFHRGAESTSTTSTVDREGFHRGGTNLQLPQASNEESLRITGPAASRFRLMPLLADTSGAASARCVDAAVYGILGIPKDPSRLRRWRKRARRPATDRPNDAPSSLS